MQNKRPAEGAKDSSHKRQRCEELVTLPVTVEIPQPTAAETSHSAIDVVQTLPNSAPPVTYNSPGMDTAPAPASAAQYLGHNDAPISDSACRLSEIAIPRKRSNPFGGGGPRKKIKTERYVNVRIYAQPTDLEHTHEIQCALTPDGDLDLAGLSKQLKVKGCDVSHLLVIPIPWPY
jgi:hypothetical protein